MSCRQILDIYVRSQDERVETYGQVRIRPG